MPAKLILNKLDKILEYLSNITSNYTISDYVEKVKKGSKKVSDKGLNEIELNKCKVELARRRYEIGKYISEKYFHDKVLDFSYDEKYKDLSKKIEDLKEYINKLTNNSK